MALSREARSVVLIGKTGSGKSSLCNILTESDEFPVGRGGLSKTECCKGLTVRVRNRELTVVDTPGTRDVKDKDKAGDELKNALYYCPDGIDAFLVTIRCDVRLTNEECKAVEDAVEIFGPECCQRVIVVFTHGGVYNNDESEFRNDLVEMRKDIPRFNALMTKFGNRWVLMDNGNGCDQGVRERQLDSLFEMIDAVARLNPQRFSKKDLKPKDKEKQKRKALEEEVKHLEQELHAMQLQRLEDKFQQAREQEVREKMMQLAVVHNLGGMQMEFMAQLHNMRMDQMRQLVFDVRFQQQLMLEDRNRESNGFSCKMQ